MRLRATHGILIALDIDSLDQMRQVVEHTTGIPGIVGYKVGVCTENLIRRRFRFLANKIPVPTPKFPVPPK
jgi:hypothetical protein